MPSEKTSQNHSCAVLTGDRNPNLSEFIDGLIFKTRQTVWGFFSAKKLEYHLRFTIILCSHYLRDCSFFLFFFSFAQLYDIKYFYLILIIRTRMYDFK